MIVSLLALILLIQATPNRPARLFESGTVTGTLRTTDGKPAVGVRVAARALQDAAESVEGAALAGLAETDASGRYRLEGVPVGRYTISAGRVDLPTYYPGTLDLSSGTVLTIDADKTTSGIDFTLADISVAAAGISAQPPAVSIPLHVGVEGGGKTPVFAEGKFVRLIVTNTKSGGQIVASLDAAALIVPFPVVPEEYRVTIESLPPSLGLKSMTYGPANLMTGTMKVTAANLPLSFSAPSTALYISLAGGTPPPPSPGGVRVTGRAQNAGVRSISLSGIPGTLYTDGTFEFRGVPPGRHVVITEDNPLNSRPFGALLVVSDRDVEGVELETVLLLPREAAPAPTTDTHPAGTVIPLAGIHGQLVSETTQQPMRGVLNVIGSSSMQAVVPVGVDGKFEIPKLLPGSYTLQVSIFDHFTINENVVVGEKDVAVTLRARRVY